MVASAYVDMVNHNLPIFCEKKIKDMSGDIIQVTSHFQNDNYLSYQKTSAQLFVAFFFFSFLLLLYIGLLLYLLDSCACEEIFFRNPGAAV